MKKWQRQGQSYMLRGLGWMVLILLLVGGILHGFDEYFERTRHEGRGTISVPAFFVCEKREILVW